MKFLNLFKKSIKMNNDIFVRHFMRGQENYISPHLAYNAYNYNSALSDSVDMISERFSDIIPVIRDKDNNIITESKVLDILKRPNNLMRYKEFASNLSINYLLNNNAFIEVIGFNKSKPSEMYPIRNTDIQITECENSANYLVTASNIYKFLSGRFRLSLENGRITDDTDLKELYHIRGFSQSYNSILSVSKINSIQNDIDIVRAATERNASLLRKGFGSNGILSVDTDDNYVFEQFTRDINVKKTGEGNYGELLVTKGKSVDFKSIELSNRDLEALRTKKDSAETVYSRYDIPKPLVDQSSQTYNNYQSSLFSLYDNAVLPLANTIFSELTQIFIDRNMLKDGEYITYDISSIPALQIRRNEELNLLSKVGILSINELRSIAGYEEVDGGDQILMNVGLATVAEDKFTEDNRDKPTKKVFGILKMNGIPENKINGYWNKYKKALIKD